MASQFDLELAEFDKAVTKQALALKRTLAQAVLSGVVKDTPRDTSQTARSWLVSVGDPRTEKTQETFQEGFSTIKRAKLGETIWVVNNEDNILVLEEGLFQPPDPGPSKDPRPERKGKILVSGGFSTQAPSGIVAPLVKEIEIIFGK